MDSWWRRFGWLTNVGLALVALNVLHAFGLAAQGTIGLLDLVLVASGVAQHPRVEHWLKGGDQQSRAAMWRQAAVGAVLTSSASYLTGWGPLLGIGFVIFASNMMRIAGARSWRAILCTSVVTAAAGQAGIALGWVPTYVSPVTAQTVGTLGTLAAALTIRILGLTTADRERATAERIHVERELRISAERASRTENRFRVLVQDSADVISVTDASGHVGYVSGAVEHVLGYPVEDYSRLAGIDLIHPDDRPASFALHRALLSGIPQDRAELRLRHADGSWRWHEVVARNMLDNPAVEGIVWNHRDITDRKHYQERLAYDATHDALTGLANRSAFLQALERACAADRPGQGAVLYLDLDGFKPINDRLGHAVGDASLVAAARALQTCAPAGAVVARLGGDEFAVLLADVRTADDAVAVAARVTDWLAEPVPIDGHLVQIGASIGIAMRLGDHADADETLRHADLAMYRAKRERQRWHLYAAEPRLPV